MINRGSISDVGSLAWAETGGPPLTAMQSLGQVAGMGMVALTTFHREVQFTLSGWGLMPERKLPSIPFPEFPSTRAVDRALELLDDYAGSKSPLAAHSYRCTHIASALAKVDEREVDEEAMAVAMLLHDIGLAPRAIEEESANEFTVRGAQIAARALADLGWKRDRIDLVSQIITLHPNTHVSAKRWGAEAHYGRLAPVCDGFGEAWRLPRNIAAEIFARHPQDAAQAVEMLDTAVSGEAGRQPGGRFSLLQPIFPPLVRFGCRRWSRVATRQAP